MPSIFKEIDQLLPEELPLGYFIMLTGPPAFGKGTFAAQYAFQGVLKNETAVYLITDSHPSEVRRVMLRFGWDVKPYEREGLFRFIDGYSWRFGGPFEEKYYISDPTNLTNVMIEINNALKDVKSPARIIFDSFSSIAWMSSTTTAIRFLQSLDGRINKEGYNGIYTVEEGMHDSITMATLRAQADGIFELKIVEEEDGLHRFFRIYNLKGISCSHKWVPVTITNNGFEFKKIKDLVPLNCCFIRGIP